MAWTNGTITIEHSWLWPLFMLLYVAFFAFLTELTRRYHVAQIICWIILPFIVAPITIIYAEDAAHSGLFTTAKLITIAVTCLVIQIIRDRLLKWQQKEIENEQQTTCKLSTVLLWSRYTIYIINIAEAVGAGVLSLSKKDGFVFPGNAIYGIMVILSLPNPTNITVTNDGYNSQWYQLGAWWIFHYTAWNAIFVFNYSGCVDGATVLLWIGSVICHLGVPLLMILWTDCEHWSQHRAYALSFYVWIWELPVIKWYLPFFRTDKECTEDTDEAFMVLRIINYVALLLALCLLCTEIYDETKSWKDEKKSHDTSCIQWITRKFKRKYEEDANDTEAASILNIN